MTLAAKKIDLGGTARSPEEVTSLFDLGLRFAEIPISNAFKFLPLVPVYESLQNKLGLFYLCHGPKEGDPNDVEALNRVYLPKVFELFPIMQRLSMPLLTIHLWMDRRFVRKESLESKREILKRIVEKAAEYLHGLVLGGRFLKNVPAAFNAHHFIRRSVNQEQRHLEFPGALDGHPGRI